MKYLSFLVIAVCFGAGILITPGSSSEPVDLPKLLVISTFGFGILASLFISVKSLTSQVNRVYLGLVLFFTLQITFVLFTSGAPFNQQLYGTFGRNTGYLAYISLAAVSMASAIISERNLLVRFSVSLIFLGGISLIYDFLQTAGNDPVKWNNPYNPIIGFLGNPDFEASFLGIVGIVLVAIFLHKEIAYAYKSATLFGLAAIGFIIYRSGAQQGFLVFALGSSIVILEFIFKSSNQILRKVRFPALGIIIFGGILALLGSLKIGPLGGILYKTSVRQRGFYWNAALNMMNHKPLNGVGLDSFGDWYFRARSTKAAIITPLVQSNAAHNVFLDLGSNGGWPLFLINIGIFIFVAYSGLKVIKRTNKYDWPFIGVFGAWLGFEAQSFISINQLGLGIWGWALRGLVVGYEFKTRKAKDLNPKDSVSTRKRKQANRKTNATPSMAMVIGCLFGFALIYPLFSGDMQYRKASATRSADPIFAAATLKPQDTGRMLQAAQLFAGSKMPTQAIQLADKIIKINPYSYNAWYLKSQVVSPNSPEGLRIAEKLRELDPKGKH